MVDDFQKVQLQLAAHLRDPEHNPPPEGLADERLAVYRRLFFNNITGFATKAFPVLHEIYDTKQWQDLIRMFYANHKSHTPYFPEIAREFLNYLKKEYPGGPNDPPFLQELAHYEWIEIALANTNREIDWAHIDKSGQLLTMPPVLSPLAWLLSYQWPVHQISPDYQPTKPEKEPTHIVLCRNQANKIQFIKINIVTKSLLENIRKHPKTSGQQHIETISQQSGIPYNEQTLQAGLDILEKMREKEVILGTTKTHL